MPEFLDPPSEELDIILVDRETTSLAVLFVLGCEGCDPAGALISFDWLLDKVTGHDGAFTDYVLEAPAKCPVCHGDILENTLVDPEWTDNTDFNQP